MTLPPHGFYGREYLPRQEFWQTKLSPQPQRLRHKYATKSSARECSAENFEARAVRWKTPAGDYGAAGGI
jgi:hypothetical protein